MKLYNPKLGNLQDIVNRRNAFLKMGKKVVLTNGVFDLLHTGHLYYLNQAQLLGDVLFIALNSDESTKSLKGPKRPIQNEEQRAYALGSMQCVDSIFVFKTTRLDSQIREIRPDVYCKAGDYTLEKIDAGERAALEEVGSQIEFMPFLTGFSTTNLIAKIKDAGSV